MREKLLALARHLETTGIRYDHTSFGTCAAAHYFEYVNYRPKWFSEAMSVLQQADGNYVRTYPSIYHFLAKYFGLTLDQTTSIFSCALSKHDGTPKDVACRIRAVADEAFPLPAVETPELALAA